MREEMGREKIGREQIERDTRDKSQLAQLGEHYKRVARGEVKTALSRGPRFNRMGFSPEERALIEKIRGRDLKP